jgi:hypothetical protein
MMSDGVHRAQQSDCLPPKATGCLGSLLTHSTTLYVAASGSPSCAHGCVGQKAIAENEGAASLDEQRYCRCSGPKD